MAASKLPPLNPLQRKWTTIYRETLPAQARTNHKKSTSTPWPVQLDHCFARIILDNAIGVDRPWTEVVKAPATRNMDEDQLEAAISLAERVMNGEEDLWRLDEQSLELRGKKSKAGTKRQREEDTHEETEGVAKPDTTLSNSLHHGVDERETCEREPHTSPANRRKRTRKDEMADIWSGYSAVKTASPSKASDNEHETLAKVRSKIISDNSLRPFRKLVLTLLTQVPRGRYTTYQALSDAATNLSTSSKSALPMPPDKKSHGCARAIGGAMRNNPFAPDAPCHRVLASDGKIGGFKGDWGTEGRFVNEKMRLLREEGVKFDGRGKVVGAPFRDFVKPHGL